MVVVLLCFDGDDRGSHGISVTCIHACLRRRIIGLKVFVANGRWVRAVWSADGTYWISSTCQSKSSPNLRHSRLRGPACMTLMTYPDGLKSAVLERAARHGDVHIKSLNESLMPDVAAHWAPAFAGGRVGRGKLKRSR